MHTAVTTLMVVGSLTATALMPCEAAARPVSMRLNIEGGAATLKPVHERRRWGTAGTLSAALGIGPLASLEAFAAFSPVGSGAKRREVFVSGMGVLYRLDILALAPIFGLGLAYVRVHDSVGLERDLLPMLMAGMDVVLSPRFVAGAILRYLPLFDSDLVDPAYSSFNVRIGIRFAP